MKHYEKLAEILEASLMKKKWGMHMKIGFLMGYKAAMEELKTSAFHYNLDGYPLNEDESNEYNFKKITMEFVTLERIYDSLNREAE